MSVFRTSSKLINYATGITFDCDYNSRKMKKYGAAIMPSLPLFEERCVRLFKALGRCFVRKRRSSFLAAHGWAEKTKIFVRRGQCVKKLIITFVFKLFKVLVLSMPFLTRYSRADNFKWNLKKCQSEGMLITLLHGLGIIINSVLLSS